MDVAIVTGSAGLIGSEAARFFADQGLRVIGIDNDMRSTFFGDDASTAWNRSRLQSDVRGYRHVDATFVTPMRWRRCSAAMPARSRR